MRRTRRRLGLRARATIGFGFTAFVVTLGLAAVTHLVAKGYLVDQRESGAVRQAYVNARLARTALRSPDPDVRAFLAALGGDTASDTVVRYRGEWFSTSVAAGAEAVPPDLVRVVGENHAGRQRFRDPSGDLRLAVGVAIPAVDTLYFELFPLTELESNLNLLRRSLLIGVLVGTVVAAGVGWAAAAKVVRPLAPVADAAERIAAGALDTRLDDIADPDLRRFSDAFNRMAAALEERIEHETRFAADVSHELRSPLTAVAAAVEIIERRRDQLPPQVIEAFNVLTDKVQAFQQMLLDLLEISRVDAGTAQFDPEPIDLAHLVDRVLAMHDSSGATVTFVPGAPTQVVGDRRRLAQVIGNVVENAHRYADGVTAVTVEPAPGGRVRVLVDDQGPGVSPEERHAIFGRFAAAAPACVPARPRARASGSHSSPSTCACTTAPSP